MLIIAFIAQFVKKILPILCNLKIGKVIEFYQTIIKKCINIVILFTKKPPGLIFYTHF